MDIIQLLERLGLSSKLHGIAAGSARHTGSGEDLSIRSPIDGSSGPLIRQATAEDVSKVVAASHDAFQTWREVPAPVRGEFVRRFGNRLREAKSDLGALVSWEAGKITSEAEGEVQEMIDICDFAVGLSRQLYGLTMATERFQHRLMEQWHPLGVVGVISAFNFPVAVWSWNSAIAWVCGDTVIWKPSEKTPLTALACQSLFLATCSEMPQVPSGISSLIIGDSKVGHALAANPRVSLVSATGSVRMGQSVAQTVAARLGRSLLELGGNNAVVVAPSADLEQAMRGIVFAAVGTCGQRCTSLRRLIVHRSIAPELIRRLKKIYQSLPIGNPLDPNILVGPLIDEASWKSMAQALNQAKVQGGKIFGGQRIEMNVPPGVYVQPAIVEIDSRAAIVQEETFAPILYVMTYDRLEEAIGINNSVPQGLSSSIFTMNMREAEQFMSASGSDCGIVNVNIGTSGAEIGGAFGGEKHTGGGRESGSDAWKNYMRRVTNTINFSTKLPLAQGIQFDVQE